MSQEASINSQNRLNLTESVVLRLCRFTLLPEIGPDVVVSSEVGKTSPSTSSNIVLILFSHSVS